LLLAPSNQMLIMFPIDPHQLLSIGSHNEINFALSHRFRIVLWATLEKGKTNINLLLNNNNKNY